MSSGPSTDLIDSDGSRCIDGVSSLWCNVHGHRHPGIDKAIRDQLDRVAHSTMLGLTHGPAAELAARLVAVRRRASAGSSIRTRARPPRRSRSRWRSSTSSRGSAATEKRTSYVCLRDAYHGDTVGAVSVGGIALFDATEPLLFDAHHVAPGDAAELECVLDFHDGEIAAVIVEPLVQGRRGSGPAAGLPAPRARALRPPRRVPDL